MAKLTPFLWFNDQAEEAMDFYTSIFHDSKRGAIHRFSDAVPGPKGKVLTGTFQVAGQEFMVLNGGAAGDAFVFNQAISLYLEVDDQTEVDYYWDALSKDGGQTRQCGWLTDKFGVTWQVVPKQLETLMNDPDEAAAERVTKAMLAMTKLEVEGLEKAYRGDV